MPVLLMQFTDVWNRKHVLTKKIFRNNFVHSIICYTFVAKQKQILSKLSNTQNKK